MTSTAELSTQVDLPQQGDWELDPAHTVAGFVGRYLMVTKVPGKFTDVAGTIHIAERPEDLVVYGGIGRAARNWECFDRIVECLRELGDDETLLVQSGKPVGVFTTHAAAPRDS